MDDSSPASAAAASLSKLSLNGTTQDSPSPKLPKPGVRNVLVTSALPYVNNVPHLGNLIGSVLSADVYSRYLRQRSTNVIYICGTDEYGTTTENKAQQEGLTPQQICDKYHRLHAQVYQWFDIAFDHFGRTSTEKQTEIVQEIFWSAYNNGYVVPQTIEQLFCEHDQRFLADRYVCGVCPKCGYEDARGVQCDNCGNLLNPSELISPKCIQCSNPPVTKQTKHLFIDLPSLEKQLAGWVDESLKEKNKWSDNATALTRTWLRDGLKTRCITRDLKWGVPVPLEGFEGKVFYVWFDAPIGYLSITAEYTSKWEQWWKKEGDDSSTQGTNVELVQFMGKDNAPFHTILFPATLLATKGPWTMLERISTTEYLNYESGKFSKSRNVGVFGDGAQATGIEAEVWRYYLLVNRPETSDTVFTWSDFAAKNNDELLKNTGNFLHRTVTFITNKFNSTLPALDEEMDEITKTHVEKINVLLKEYHEQFESCSLKSALKTAMAISSVGNSYFQIKQPWDKAKKRQDAGNALAFAANIAMLVIILLEPFLGSKFAAKALSQLGIDAKERKNHLIPDEFTFLLKEGHRIANSHQPLFTKISNDRIKELRQQFGGAEEADATNAGEKDSQGASFPLDLRVGCVKELEHHPENESLCVLQVDLGEEKPRTIVAGSLRDTGLENSVVGMKITVVCNMQKVSLGGVESEGMILMGNSSVGKGEKKVKSHGLLSLGDKGVVGKRILPKSIANNFNDSCDPKVLDRKAFQKASKGLKIGKEGYVVWKKDTTLVSAGDDGEWIDVHVEGVAEGGKVK